jgi:hypothetical protein
VTTSPRSPRWLLLSTAVLAVTGIALLSGSHGRQAPVPQAASTTQPPTQSAAAPPATGGTPARTTPGTPAPVFASVLPPHGEGTAGDAAVQRSLERAWPADLPVGDERQLLIAGRALLRADATGVGRSHWPDVFPGSGQAVAPVFATARFRIQAAIARRDGSPGKAVVHLVWAGTDRGGTFTDLRITDLHFTRTTSKKGAATWTPQPRI